MCEPKPSESNRNWQQIVEQRKRGKRLELALLVSTAYHAHYAFVLPRATDQQIVVLIELITVAARSIGMAEDPPSLGITELVRVWGMVSVPSLTSRKPHSQSDVGQEPFPASAPYYGKDKGYRRGYDR